MRIGSGGIAANVSAIKALPRISLICPELSYYFSKKYIQIS